MIREPPRSVPSSPRSSDAQLVQRLYASPGLNNDLLALVDPRAEPLDARGILLPQLTPSTKWGHTAVGSGPAARTDTEKPQNGFRLSSIMDLADLPRPWPTLASKDHPPQSPSMHDHSARASSELDISGEGACAPQCIRPIDSPSVTSPSVSESESKSDGGFGYSFRAVYGGREGEFHLSESRFSNISSDSLLACCSRAMKLSADDDVPTMLFLLLMPESSVYDSLDIAFEGYTILPIQAWSPSFRPTLQFLLIKRIFSALMRSEGWVHLLCTGEEEKEGINAASEHFWKLQSERHQPDTRSRKPKVTLAIETKPYAGKQATLSKYFTGSRGPSSSSFKRSSTVFHNEGQDGPPALTLALPSTRLNFNSIYSDRAQVSSPCATTARASREVGRRIVRNTSFSGFETGDKLSVSMTEPSSRFSDESARVEDIVSMKNGNPVWRWACNSHAKLTSRRSESSTGTSTQLTSANSRTYLASPAADRTHSFEESSTESLRQSPCHSWSAKTVEVYRSRVNSFSSILRSRSDTLRADCSSTSSLGLEFLSQPSGRSASRGRDRSCSKGDEQRIARDVCRNLLLRPRTANEKLEPLNTFKALPHSPTPADADNTSTSHYSLEETPCHTLEEKRQSSTESGGRSSNVSSQARYSGRDYRLFDSPGSSPTLSTKRPTIRSEGFKRITSTSTLSTSPPETPMSASMMDHQVMADDLATNAEADLKTIGGRPPGLTLQLSLKSTQQQGCATEKDDVPLRRTRTTLTDSTCHLARKADRSARHKRSLDMLTGKRTLNGQALDDVSPRRRLTSIFPSKLAIADDGSSRDTLMSSHPIQGWFKCDEQLVPDVRDVIAPLTGTEFEVRQSSKRSSSRNRDHKPSSAAGGQRRVSATASTSISLHSLVSMRSLSRLAFTSFEDPFRSPKPAKAAVPPSSSTSGQREASDGKTIEVPRTSFATFRTRKPSFASVKGAKARA